MTNVKFCSDISVIRMLQDLVGRNQGAGKSIHPSNMCIENVGRICGIPPDLGMGKTIAELYFGETEGLTEQVKPKPINIKPELIVRKSTQRK